MDRENYIIEKVEIDYIIKSKNSALAFGLVAFVFLFLHSASPYKNLMIIITALVMLISVHRILNVKNFFDKKVSRTKAAQIVSYTVILNGALWSALGFLSFMSYPELSINIIITLILILAFISGSIVTISSKRSVLIFYNLLLLAPIAFYSVWITIKTGEMQGLVLLVLNGINLFYTLKQSEVVCSELRRRISGEFDLKKSLDELEQSKKTLEEESVKTFHASRLSSLGEMAGGVAHEINNPLTIIQGLSNTMLKDSPTMDPEFVKKLTKIHSASERIAKIVKGMKLISSKNDKIEHERVHLDKIFEISLGLFEERLKNEKIDFTLINPDNPAIICNPLQVSQIFINLLSNAVDALQKDEEKRFIRIEAGTIDNNVVIRLINSGPLLSPEIAKKIFEPFFSTKAMGQGTGLGLSISQTLASNNGGTLQYEPYEGHISFILRFSRAL